MNKEKRIKFAKLFRDMLKDELDKFSKSKVDIRYLDLKIEHIKYSKDRIYFIEYLIDKTEFFNLYRYIDFKDYGIKCINVSIEFDREDISYKVTFNKDNSSLFLNNTDERIFEGEFNVFINKVMTSDIDVKSIKNIIVKVVYNDNEFIGFNL